MQEFNGKVAVITGAGRGIGRGIALRCAQEGMKIVLAGIGMESLTGTDADLRAMGAETLVVQTDVSLLSDVEALAEKSYDHFGRVDLLVNNAGVATPGTVLGISMSDWHWVMGVNFYGVLHGVRAFIPRMMEGNSGGHVVNVASISGMIPAKGGSYGVSKHAVVVMTESLYHELADTAPNIKVSVYCPGWVSTEFDTIERSRPERLKNSEPPAALTPERQATWRQSLAGGVSIEESADILFEGLRADRLYIGPQAFEAQDPDYNASILKRAGQMVNEENP